MVNLFQFLKNLLINHLVMKAKYKIMTLNEIIFEISITDYEKNIENVT
ncbi:MAG: hypothetical protein NPMRD2_1830003, partial [Nitrosopumilales archaeon]